MIRLVVNYGALLYCLCCIFSLFSTETFGSALEDCGSQNFSQAYNIADPEQCDKFYVCDPAKNATGNVSSISPTVAFCLPGFRFSTEVGECVDYKRVNCTGRDFDSNRDVRVESCPVKDGKFLCKSGKQCIDSTLLCNKDFDCLDASDEFANCGSICKSKTCQHICVPTPPLMAEDFSTAGTCLCRQGYAVSPNNSNQCVDVDECRDFTSCSQICSNSVGSFQCSCIEGFKVGDSDKSSCEAKDPNWNLVYATRTEVHYISHIGAEQIGKFPLTSNTGRPVAVTYDARTEATYWTDASANSEKIYRKFFSGNGSSEIIADTGIILPEGIEFGWIAGNIYFADSNLSHIAVCGNNSNFCSVLVQEVLDQPRDIALHPNQGIMLWTDWGEVPAIMRAGMDGSLPIAIVTTDLKWPNGITIDQGSGRAYWVDAGLDRIETVLLDGQDRQLIISVKNNHPFGLDIFGDRIFWSDWNNFNIRSANKLTGLQRKVQVQEPNVLMNGLAVYHVANQPIRRSNPCRNARCSHICTLSPVVNFRCLCPVGMTLDNDGKTCVEPSNAEKLVIAFKNTIKMMRFNSIGRDVFESITFPELKTISAVVYNPVNHTIIMSDSSHKKIYEYIINRKKLEVLIDEHLDSVKGLDIDPISENLYWVDAGRQTVEVMSFRTRARMVLMTGVENPYDILVVPQQGALYLARIGRRGGKIYKMNLNGYSNSVFQRVGEKEPMGLAYDKELENILWADKVNRGVESISSDGKSSSVIVREPEGGPPSDVVKHRNQVYWTDMFSEDLKSISLGNKYVRTTKIGSFEGGNSSTANNHTNFFPKMTVINRDMSHLDALRDTHECSWKNPKRKPCSHICVMDSVGFTGACMCPEGLSMDEDGATCFKLSTCSQEQFTCQDGHCISKQYLCDGVADCSNHDDEVNCQAKECDKEQFKCETNGVCISSHWVCDGEADCPDRADERNCSFIPCNDEFDFRCDSGRCIPKAWHCDHAYDCPGDDSDERGCDFTCPDGFFQCATSQNCIVRDWVCDKEKDCEDGSDEMQNCDGLDCPEHQFTCRSGRCIDIAMVCDGSADCAHNEDEEHCDTKDPNERDSANITVVPVVGMSEDDGTGATVAIVFAVLIIIVLVAIIIALVLHKRNIQPKVLVRPYVHLWNRHVNEPARRLFNDGRRQQKLDCEMNEYDEVYAGGTATYYNTNNVYEEVDGATEFEAHSPNAEKRGERDANSRSFADSGILGSERESLYEEAEDCGSHHVSYNLKDKLLAD